MHIKNVLLLFVKRKIIKNSIHWYTHNNTYTIDRVYLQKSFYKIKEKIEKQFIKIIGPNHHLRMPSLGRLLVCVG